MANRLPKEKQTLVLRLLCEGSSIRSVERVTGVHRDTVMKILVKFGRAAERLMDTRMKGLRLGHVEIDEMWTYIQVKQGNLRAHHKEEHGDCYIYLAIDRDTKFIPCFATGKREFFTTRRFVGNLSNQIDGRVKISTDGLADYPECVDLAFDTRADHGVLDKSFIGHEVEQKRKCVLGSMDRKCIGTSRIERANCTARNYVRRCTRKTLA